MKIGQKAIQLFTKLVEQKKMEQFYKIHTDYNLNNKVIIKKVLSGQSIEKISRDEKGHLRYHVKPFYENNETYLLCNDWYAKNENLLMAIARKMDVPYEVNKIENSETKKPINIPKNKMQKIRMIETGEILEKPQAWILHYARKLGVDFDLYKPDKKKNEHQKNNAEILNSVMIIKPINMTRKITPPITRAASLVRQGDLTLYATSLKVSDLLEPNFYSIDRLDPQNDKGYQRVLNENRAKKLCNYILGGLEKRDAFLPTSIFMATDQNIPFNPSNNTIEIDINKIGAFNIVDGQHRAEGLRMAANLDKRVLDFEIPVNIAINLKEIAQMCHFLVVNTTQKSVDEGVAQRIRARLSGYKNIEDYPTLPEWIEKIIEKGEDKNALNYVDYLNEEEDSPWYNNIKMVNDKTSKGSINQKSFVNSIKRYVIVVNNPIYHMKPEDKQYKIFLNYWKAITNIIGIDEPTVLFKYNGVELFCRFSVPFFMKVSNKNYEVSTMQALLKQVFENMENHAEIGNAEYWISGNEGSKINNSALTSINYAMVEALQKTNL